MREADVLRCQFQEWYPRFRRVSLKSEFLPLPEDFVSYLLDDGGVYVAKTSEAIPRRPRTGEVETFRAEYEPFDESDDAQDEPEG